MATYLYRLGRFSYRRRRIVIALWLAVLAVVGIGAATLSGPGRQTPRTRGRTLTLSLYAHAWDQRPTNWPRSSMRPWPLAGQRSCRTRCHCGRRGRSARYRQEDGSGSLKSFASALRWLTAAGAERDRPMS